MAQEQNMKPTSLSGNKGTGNTSVDADALPFTFTPMPMAFKPPADDPLIQIFEKLGQFRDFASFLEHLHDFIKDKNFKYFVAMQIVYAGKKLCFKCHKKVQTESMVLCQCGYFICRECYLAGCYCTEECKYLANYIKMACEILVCGNVEVNIIARFQKHFLVNMLEFSFLVGSGSAASTPDKRKDSASTYYISVGSTSQEINLEGKEYQLECLFTCPMQM